MPININNLSFTYDQGLAFEKNALININFHVEKGEIIGIIGQSGSGKSTLIQHLNGLIKPQSKGVVIVDGIDLADPATDLSKIRQQVGIVFQYPETQLFEESIEKDVAFGPKNLGFSKEEIEVLVKDSLSLVGLDYTKYVGRSPLLLSGGEKRRVAIAGILAMKPEYLVLDEPTAGLDPFAKEEILKEIIRINQSRNTAVILVSHDMDEIAEIAERIYVLKKGSIVLEGSTETVFSNFEYMESLGLSLPETMKILHELSLCYNGISLHKFNMNETVDEIIKYLNYKKNHGN